MKLKDVLRVLCGIVIYPFLIVAAIPAVPFFMGLILWMLAVDFFGENK